MVTSYLLTDTIATVLAGKFGDLFGRKLVFQLSAGLFVAASLMCALATSMAWLVSWRAVQGIGAGGLMVTATALIADVVPLRERGKYQGALGAVFGVTTVIGPLLGGLFTDHLSWHWCFIVNVPIGILVIAVAAKTMPSVRTPGPADDRLRGHRRHLGRRRWPDAGHQPRWDAVRLDVRADHRPVLAALLGIPAFVFAERRAAEPMLPLHLFKSAVFSLSSVISLVVGFAMLGAMTFLPTYLQYVHGVSATSSGLRTLPMVVGLFVASITAGTIVGRTGRYKIFPILGSLFMTVGLLLMSTMDENTGFVRISLFMLVLGVGIGLCMQILTIIVQNTSDYADLGVATSGVTFFRALGSSFGAAVFGAVYSGKLQDVLPRAVLAVRARSAAGRPHPSPCTASPPTLIAPIVQRLRRRAPGRLPVRRTGGPARLRARPVPPGGAAARRSPGRRGRRRRRLRDGQRLRLRPGAGGPARPADAARGAPCAPGDPDRVGHGARRCRDLVRRQGAAPGEPRRCLPTWTRSPRARRCRRASCCPPSS